MRRWIGLMAGLVSLFCLMAGAQGQQNSGEKQSSTFTFLHFTDTHQTASGGVDALKQVASEASKMPLRPVFAIDTGDVTEAGRPEEYARFKEGLSALTAEKMDFYAVPGNHDVRWSPDGKEGFAKAFGKLYQSFDYGGAHFVLLDTTVLLEHWGHFDKAQLDWLAKDLKKVKPETPVLLFMHHPLGRDVPSKRPIDNEYDIWPLLRNRNVAAIFTGHGHADLVWKINGMTAVMAKGLYQGSYHRVTVTPLLITIERVTKENPSKPVVVARIPVRGKNGLTAMRTGWNDPEVPFLARRRPAALLSPRAFNDVPEKEQGEYRIDDGPWKSLTKDARDIWSDAFPTKDIPIGVHSVDVKIVTATGDNHEDELIFEVERNENEPTRRWATNLDGSIQSSPLVLNDLVYVTSLDGKVTALDRDKGKKRWSFATKGAILASPVVAAKTLYVGSSDRALYALDVENGRQRWRFEADSPLMATAAVAKGIVCVGGNGKIYGIDTETGKPRWTQIAGGFFQSRAVTDGETFFLGGWDNTVYALDAVTGSPRWKVPMGYNKAGQLSFYYAPAIASPCVVASRVYVCSNDGWLHALDKRTGEEVWKVRAPEGQDGFGYSSPAVSGTTLLLAGLGDRGDVYAVHATTGQILWSVSTGQTIYDSSPKIAPDGSSLAILGVRGHVSVLSTANGQKLWSYELGPGNIFSTPDYDGKIVYTATMANDVQALNGPGVGTPALRPAKKPAPNGDRQDTR